MATSKNATVPYDSWSALAAELKIPQHLVSRTVRTLLAVQGGELPNISPSPKIAGRAFVDQVISILSKTRQHPHLPEKQSVALNKAKAQKAIRACIDKHQRLLGDNLCETVADELDVSLEDVRKVMKESWEALKLERKIKAEMIADDMAERSRHIAATEAAQERAERAQPPLPVMKRPAPHEAESLPLTTEPRAVRPKSFPCRGENITIDEILRAAWIANRAGVEDTYARTAAALEDLISVPCEVDIIAAIEASYGEQSELSRKKMERRAESMFKKE